MAIFLPPEILDLIVENLCDERETLKACCLVSKSWIPRTRTHLFAHVVFDDSPFESWMKTFPDPSNSPAHYTRNLSICTLPDVITVTTHARAWIRTFCNITHLTVNTVWWDDGQVSLVPLHALSPSLKSLCLLYDSIPLQDVFNLIFSFPYLEDLSLTSLGSGGTSISNTPLTPPKFTGPLRLASNLEAPSIISQLLAFPDGLRFSQLSVQPRAEDMQSITELVSACCDTLESFTISCRFPPVYSGAAVTQVPLDFSKATKLKSIKFLFGRVRWISTVLQTIKSKNLEQITIHQGITISKNKEDEEELLPEWHEPDRLLVQFWTSLSIRPDLVDETGDLREIEPTLFPELTRRGL